MILKDFFIFILLVTNITLLHLGYIKMLYSWLAFARDIVRVKFRVKYVYFQFCRDSWELNKYTNKMDSELVGKQC